MLFFFFRSLHFFSALYYTLLVDSQIEGPFTLSNFGLSEIKVDNRERNML